MASARSCSSLLLAATILALTTAWLVCAGKTDEPLSLEPRLPSRGAADRGCHACRAGNCSLAVADALPGVYCGDLVTTFQPCCCAFRNECMTTIFSEACECFDSAEEEELLTTRFYLFVALTMLAWAMLIYDKMCGGPYKVANSSHVPLANSPSAARSVASSDSEDDADNSLHRDGEARESDDGGSGAQVELTVLSSPRASSSARGESDAGSSAAASVDASSGSDGAAPSGSAAPPTSASATSANTSSGAQVALPASFSASDETTESV